MTAVLPARLLHPARVLPPVARADVPGGRPAGAHRAGGRVATSPAQVAVRLAGWTMRRLADLVLVVAVLAFLGLAVGPHMVGYRTATMLTTSMAPVIDPGDVVVDTPLAVADIEPGMVITYHIPVGDRRIVSHRVLSADIGADGSVTVRTRGDANDAADPWAATFAPGDTAWQVRAVVPGLGRAIQVLRTPGLSHALVLGVPALLVGWVLLAVWRPARDDS